MAAAKPKAKPKNKKPIPKTAAEKAAKAALYSSQQVSVEAQAARARQAARGFGGNRQLRAGGTNLMGYDLQRFKSDPFPALNGGNGNLGGGGGPAAGSARTGARSGARANDGRTGISKAEGRRRVKQQEKAKASNERRGGTMRAPINTELREERERLARQRAAEEAKRKAAAAKKRKQKLTDSKGGVVKALGTRSVIS